MDRQSEPFVFGNYCAYIVNCSPLSFLITFANFRGSHTGSRIAEEIDKSITEKKLEGKVKYIVTDNASNMKRAFDVLKELHGETDMAVATDQTEPDEGVLDDESLWQDLADDDSRVVNQAIEGQCATRLPCFAHTLQLVVKDGLAKLTSAPVRLVTAKCSKLCNLVHQSALFKDAFEQKFGNGRSLPKANDTRWNSTYRHLSAIAKLDHVILAALLREQNQQHLLMTPKELAILQELVEILQPFAEVTDLTQGENNPTIGCIVALHSYLVEMIERSVHHTLVIRTLKESFCRRFLGLLQVLLIIPSDDSGLRRATSNGNTFGSMLYAVASLLDPSYGLLWIDDHPGSVDVK